jgi:hypothetical protein
MNFGGRNIKCTNRVEWLVLWLQGISGGQKFRKILLNHLFRKSKIIIQKNSTDILHKQEVKSSEEE